MDVKTLLLLGAGMVVLTLVGFCSVQSRSASADVAGAESDASPARPAAPGAGKPAYGQLIRNEIAAVAPSGAHR